MEIKLTADLLADGWSTDEVLRLTRTGALERIRRGAYDQAPAADLDPVERHRRLIAATVMRASGDGAVSHVSAAVLHGLPTWRRQLSRVHLTRDHPGGGVLRYVHLHAAPLTQEDVALVDGHQATAVARRPGGRGGPVPRLAGDVLGPPLRFVSGRAKRERRRDGKVKYAELLQPGQTASDAVYKEKCREDALCDLGWQVVRWNWADLKDPAALRRRLERAFQRGRGASRPT